MTSSRLKMTNGLIGGEFIQIAEGHYPGSVGAGIAMSDEAFDLIEQHIEATCAAWTSAHRYGIFILSSADRLALTRQLRDASEGSKLPAENDVFRSIADWLDARSDPACQISIFGY